MENYILQLYINYIKIASNREKCYITFNSYNHCGVLFLDDDEKRQKYYSNCLNITEIQENINKYWINNNIIVLRPYCGENTLIIGCGNIICYNQDKKDLYWKNFSSKHVHENVYTIGPDIEMNPSICAEFGYNAFSSIPDESFEFIIFEGFMFNTFEKDILYFFSEMIRLLKNNGWICMANPKFKKLFIKKDNIFVSYDDKHIIKNNIDTQILINMDYGKL